MILVNEWPPMAFLGLCTIPGTWTSNPTNSLNRSLGRLGQGRVVY